MTSLSKALSNKLHVPFYYPGDAKNMGRLVEFYLLLFFLILSVDIRHKARLAQHSHTTVLKPWQCNECVVYR